MFRTRKKTQEAKSQLRRLLSEQLENRQLMASDTMQWASVPSHLISVSSSSPTASSDILGAQFGGHARTTMVGNTGFSMNFGQAFLVGSIDLSQIQPSTGFAIRGTASPLSSGPVVEGRIEVSKLDLNNLPKDGSFGKTTEVAVGDAYEIEFGEAILVGEVELADVIPVMEALTSKMVPASPLSSGPVVEGRIEASKLDPNNLPKDGSFGKTTEVAVGDAYEVAFSEAILVGEVELADVIPVMEALTSKMAPASPLSSGPVVEGRIEASKLDPNNLPKDGSFGKTTEVAVGDAYEIEFGEAILVGEVELADVIPVMEALTSKMAPASPLSSGPVVEGRIEASKLDPNNLPKDGSFGKTTEVAVGDAYEVAFSEAILVGEVELADVIPVTQVLTSKMAPASPLSSGPVVEGRIESSKLDPNNLPKDGSFGKTTEVAVGDAYEVAFSEAILVGEVELADVIPVTQALTSKMAPASPLSSGPVVEGRTESSKLDPNNLPKDGSFGKTTEVAVGDAYEVAFSEAILVGEVELADVIPVMEALTSKMAPASPLSSGPVVEGRIEASKLDPNNLPKDGSFGKTTEVAVGDAYEVAFSEAILVGEVELADVIPVTQVLTSKMAPASPLSSGPVVEGRIESSKLDPNNLPKDGSFGKTTEVVSSTESSSKVGKNRLLAQHLGLVSQFSVSAFRVDHFVTNWLI